MFSEILQPQWPGIRNQQGEYTVAGRQRTDLPCKLFVDADGDEVAQGVVIADHPQGAEPGMQQPARRHHDALQDCIQAQVLGYGYNRLEQPGHAFLGLLQLLGPGTKTLQQFVEPRIRVGGAMAMALTR
jgi:hypothetical protein